MNYNYVEEKVDTFMVDKLEAKYPGVKGKVTKASKHSKRLAIASILGDPKTFELIKKTLNLQKSDEYLTNLDELIVLFRKYVGIADVEKKTLGEVMTPIPLVEDMLDTLPSEVWCNPNKKWFDPCAGVGTFPSIVVQRLMKGLEKVIPNPEKRYGHIIENMIYVCELQEKNLFVFNCVFDLGDNNATNSYCGSFLDENFDNHMTNVWGVEKFDIIIGNPPYNDGSDNNGAGHVLWDKFVSKSLDLVLENGYLNFVHPNGWRNVDGAFKKLQKKMLSKTFLRLSLHSAQEGIKTFGVTTSYDYYTIINKPNRFKSKTQIRCQDELIEEVYINELEFIPNGKFDMVYSLLAKDDDEKVNVIYSRSSYGTDKINMSKNQDNDFKYPCVYSVLKGGVPTIKYSNTNCNGHFGVEKIIFGKGANPTYMLDKKGEYGMTEFAFGVADYDMDIIEKAIKSGKLKELTAMTKFVSTAGNPIVYPKIISLFRKDFWKQFLND